MVPQPDGIVESSLDDPRLDESKEELLELDEPLTESESEDPEEEGMLSSLLEADNDESEVELESSLEGSSFALELPLELSLSLELPVELASSSEGSDEGTLGPSGRLLDSVSKMVSVFTEGFGSTGFVEDGFFKVAFLAFLSEERFEDRLVDPD